MIWHALNAGSHTPILTTRRDSMNIKQNKIVRWGAAALVVGGLLLGTLASAGAASAAGLERYGGPTGRTTAPVTGSYRQTPVAPLDAAEMAALTEAINEEYGALNTYQAVLSQFGSVTPFSRIVRAEQQHVNALARLFTKYGLPVPANPGLVPAPTFASLTAACQTGVDAEIADAKLYDTLKPSVDNADVLQVFANLQAASLNSHLPAFDACN
jgi:hypothetical protein